MESYEALLAWGRERLAGAGIEEADLDAWYLFSEAFEMTRASYFLKKKCRPEETFSRQREEQFVRFIDRRSKRIPLQYILGNQEFMGLLFQVDESVLIPRQDTETLVEEVLSDCRARKARGCSVLDLCTGSGCIAISLDLLGRDFFSRVWASDLSEQAIRTAKGNAARLGSRAQFFCGDLFAPVPKEPVDILVSNPPYIPEAVISTLMPEVRDFEPRMALWGPDNGLYFYRRIARESAGYVKPGGAVYVEIGCDQGNAVCDIFREQGWSEIRIQKDLAGRDRVVKARLPEKNNDTTIDE